LFHRKYRVTPENIHQFANTYGVGDDTPVFHGLFDFCSGYAGASVEAARSLVTKKSDIAINWTGGLHHAQRFKANGFCYVNDIVLAILQMLRFYPRVLYIDIDVHHGDGVEQAFWKTDRVMTLSFHKYAPENFFPGTGNISEYGPTPHYKAGSHFSLNVPLEDGIEDDEYVWLFREIVGPAVDAYRPSAIVLQCGADSLAGDRLGRFNLNIPAHGACLAFVKQLRLPLLVLGGGGYTPRNVARLWAYETALCVGATLREELPHFTPHRRFFEPDATLLPRLSSASAYENRNTRAQLQSHIRTVREYLRYVARSPSVVMDYFPPGFDELREQIDRQYEEERQANDDAHRRNLEQGVGTGARGQLY
jgi:histone deacetylase HOS2